MKIESWLAKASQTLTKANVPSARLDALILLEDALHKDRSFVLAYGEEELTDGQLSSLNKQLQRRTAREPLAYIRGFSEFYGRLFTVNKDVLIPRPESELIIEEALKLKLPTRPVIADVGTGSGSLATTLALELPKASVHAYDISGPSLEVAKGNARRFKTAVDFQISNLLDGATHNFDLIVANLPYVANEQLVSPETKFEPSQALYAEADGLAAIQSLLRSLNRGLLKNGGYLVLEAEPRQHQTISTLAQQQKLVLITTNGFIQVFVAKP